MAVPHEARMPEMYYSTKDIAHLPTFLQRIQAHNDWYNKRLLIGQMVHCIVDYHCWKRRCHGSEAWEAAIERWSE